jgi:hypothetical protein
VQISSHLKRQGKFQAPKKENERWANATSSETIQKPKCASFLLFFTFGKARNQTKKFDKMMVFVNYCFRFV